MSETVAVVAIGAGTIGMLLAYLLGWWRGWAAAERWLADMRPEYAAEMLATLRSRFRVRR